jgi:hypothetical protein
MRSGAVENSTCKIRQLPGHDLLGLGGYKIAIFARFEMAEMYNHDHQLIPSSGQFFPRASQLTRLVSL